MYARGMKSFAEDKNALGRDKDVFVRDSTVRNENGRIKWIGENGETYRWRNARGRTEKHADGDVQGAGGQGDRLMGMQGRETVKHADSDLQEEGKNVKKCLGEG